MTEEEENKRDAELSAEISFEFWDVIKKVIGETQLTNNTVFYIIINAIGALAAIMTEEFYDCRIERCETKEEMKKLIADMAKKYILETKLVIEKHIFH